MHTRPVRARLRVEALEPRTVPALIAGTTETFDTLANGTLPAGWSSWGSAAFQTTAGTQAGDMVLASSTTSSAGAGRAWSGQTLDADSGAAVTVTLNSLQPVHLFVRGQGLDGTAPTYYAASITRGLEVQLLKVVDGVTTVLKTLKSVDYVSGVQARLYLRAEGDQLAVGVQRLDKQQFLKSDGTWQSAATDALTATDTSLTAGGLAGVARPARYAGAVQVDDFTPYVPEPGSPRSGWAQWSNTGADLFSPTPNSKTGVTATASTSSASSRAWLKQTRPADVQVTASVLLDTLNPAQVLARGVDLDKSAADYYAVSITRGLQVQLVKVIDGVTTTLATLNSAAYFSGQWVRVTLRAQGSSLTAIVQRLDNNQYLNASGQWQTAATAALTTSDTSLTAGGLVGLARPARYVGTLYFDNLTASAPTTDPGTTPPPAPPPSPLPKPTVPSIPQHYSWIRLANLAYSGTPLDTFAQNLLRNSIDLVVPNTSFLGTIDAITPNTPQLIYSNVSNLYLSLLTDWLAFADAHGYPREAAFYHAASAINFSGSSPSSVPVTWFWGVSRGPATGSGTWTDLTAPARSGSGGGVAFGTAGQAIHIGGVEKFREVNVTLSTPASGGWSGVLEYVSAVDSAGRPTAWKTLNLLGDSTLGLTRSGTFTFDPPADWVASSVNGSARLFYVRVRTTSTSGTPPVASSILGRDYVGANGTNTGTIPAFDTAADANGDGYLNDAEYAKRAAGFDARFVYESRVFVPNYGQMRFAVNPGGTGVKEWSADYIKRFLDANPLADGVFLDNSSGRSPVKDLDTRESDATYTADYAAQLSAVNTAIAPKWVLANSAGNYAETDQVFAAVPAGMEEFVIRAMANTANQFRDVANMVARRLQTGNYLILDSLPTNGSPTDARTQLATLAYYYLLADPKQTFLMMYGGYEPSSSWTRHFTAAATVDVGQPVGTWSVRQTGIDPANAALTYTVLQRKYGNGLVLYKPLSSAIGQPAGTTADNTATAVALGGSYRVVNADGTLGPVVTSVTMRNGEGVILVKA